MRKYTMETHVRRVKQILKRKEPCKLCPVALSRGYDGGVELWSDDFHPCSVCLKFLGLTGYNCPCTQLGKDEAITKAHLAVEKWEAEHK